MKFNGSYAIHVRRENGEKPQEIIVCGSPLKVAAMVFKMRNAGNFVVCSKIHSNADIQKSIAMQISKEGEKKTSLTKYSIKNQEKFFCNFKLFDIFIWFASYCSEDGVCGPETWNAIKNFIRAILDANVNKKNHGNLSLIITHTLKKHKRFAQSSYGLDKLREHTAFNILYQEKSLENAIMLGRSENSEVEMAKKIGAYKLA